ncbi:MAG TPA: histidinol-phosphate transaminase [Planctomycetaceae bacterium]|nr:histidinol-phosphate transaminase [Planctomycetaceae bacterium]
MSLFRPNVERLEGYVPGEQPQEDGWVKLNTNENPYPPSPRVREAIFAAASGRLNVYPDPLATDFRRRAARLFGLDPDWILPANGSDENLTILMRTFVDPGERIAFPYPSYILYETLADIQGAVPRRLPLNENWSWDFAVAELIVKQAKIVFVPNPNSPSGHLWPKSELLRLLPSRGVLVLDQAYIDFADPTAAVHILQDDGGDRIVITRTLSKSYSLAGIRFGFAVAHPDLIAGMRKVKDSYNCDALSLAAACAALDDQDWMRENVQRIQATRSRLIEALRSRGFIVPDSEANFVWATRPEGDHRRIYEELKQRRILVRYMQFPDAGPRADQRIDGLRITVGTDGQVDRFLEELDRLL